MKKIIDGIDISLEVITNKEYLSKSEALAILKILPQNIGQTNALELLGRDSR